MQKDDKLKTNISVPNLLQLKLRDTFRFVIYHDLKHVKQAKIIFQS